MLWDSIGECKKRYYGSRFLWYYNHYVFVAKHPQNTCLISCLHCLECEREMYDIGFNEAVVKLYKTADNYEECSKMCTANGECTNWSLNPQVILCIRLYFVLSINILLLAQWYLILGLPKKDFFHWNQFSNKFSKIKALFGSKWSPFVTSLYN